MITDRGYRYLVILLAAFLFAACSTDDIIGPQEENTDVISFGTVNAAAGTRADIFESDAHLQDGHNFGGNCMINAWLANRDQKYIQDARLWYLSEKISWIFLDNTHSEYNHYWPKIEGSSWPLDIIAYSPWTYTNTNDQNDNNIQDITKYKQAYTGISDVTRTSDYKVTFNCNLPQKADDAKTEALDDQNELTEFIYAFAKGKDKAYQDSHNNVVPLKFRHPLSAIYFKLKQAHRDLTLQKIVIKNLYTTGSFTSDADTNPDNGSFSISSSNWTGTGDRNELTLNINKKIPDDINFNAMVGGPYLVMPQAMTWNTDGKLTMEIHFNWSGNITTVAGILDKVDENGNYKATVDLSGLTITGADGNTATLSSWEPGIKYTYTLDLGDNKEEILFKVYVESWKTPESDTNIEVE